MFMDEYFYIEFFILKYKLSIFMRIISSKENEI